MAFSGILPSICSEGSTLSFPHMAAGCARGGTDGRVRAAGWGPVENGYVRHAALQPGIVSRASAAERLVDHDAGLDRHRLRRTGGHGAAEYEEIDRVLLG